MYEKLAINQFFVVYLSDMKQRIHTVLRAAWQERYKFAKYVIVGVSSVAIDIALLTTFVELFKWNPTVSTVMNQAIVLGFNFTLNKKWTFTSSGAAHKELIRYLMLSVWNYLFAVSAMYVGNERWDLPYLLVRIASIACMVLWNFALFRFWVYRERKGVV